MVYCNKCNFCESGRAGGLTVSKKICQVGGFQAIEKHCNIALRYCKTYKVLKTL